MDCPSDHMGRIFARDENKAIDFLLTIYLHFSYKLNKEQLLYPKAFVIMIQKLFILSIFFDFICGYASSATDQQTMIQQANQLCADYCAQFSKNHMGCQVSPLPVVVVDFGTSATEVALCHPCIWKSLESQKCRQPFESGGFSSVSKIFDKRKVLVLAPDGLKDPTINLYVGIPVAGAEGYDDTKAQNECQRYCAAHTNEQTCNDAPQAIVRSSDGLRLCAKCKYSKGCQLPSTSIVFGNMVYFDKQRVTVWQKGAPIGTQIPYPVRTAVGQSNGPANGMTQNSVSGNNQSLVDDDYNTVGPTDSSGSSYPSDDDSN